MDKIDYVLVDAEHTSGNLSGVFYGYDVRILLRTPDKILFVARGLHALYNRTSNQPSYHDHKNLISGRIKRDLIKKGAAKIDEHFGENASEATLLAWKERKTALIDGGGTPMRLSRSAEKARFEARLATSNDWKADLTGKVATCKQCGANLQPHFVNHHLAKTIKDGHPRTMEECQRLTNLPVVAMHCYKDENRWNYVQWFETWDGEAMVTKNFCKPSCAAIYGERAVSELPPLPVGGEAPVHEKYRHEYVRHYEEEEPSFVVPGGTLLL